MCTQFRFVRRLELQVFLRRGRLVHTSTTTSANEEQLTPFEKWYGHKPNISHLKVFVTGFGKTLRMGSARDSGNARF